MLVKNLWKCRICIWICIRVPELLQKASSENEAANLINYETLLEKIHFIITRNKYRYINCEYHHDWEQISEYAITFDYILIRMTSQIATIVLKILWLSSLD